MISIIIPVYNVEKYLRRCLDSILNQTYKDFEIILVDDQSTDNSFAVCKEYSDKYNNVICLQNEKRSGSGASRN